MRGRPLLSIVMVVHRMPEQAARTLHSLSPAYQRGVRAEDYEVIVVENPSDQILGAEAAGPVRYFLRAEAAKSPVGAVNFGVAQARADHVAILIDGARMLSPGVVAATLAALRADPAAAVSAPGYHLGHELQQVAVNKGHDAAADRALLEGIGWPADGYRLFEIAVLSGSCRQGFFKPHAESNFLALSRQKFQALGGMDARYDDLGGGMANLDFYKRLLESPGTPLYLLFGEGSFHQFHGGITTNTPEAERAAIMQAIKAQDEGLRGAATALPTTAPILFGTAHPAVMRFVEYSLKQVRKP
jgi:glycosyltransferase involved in cell wall biosynthesis